MILEILFLLLLSYTFYLHVKTRRERETAIAQAEERARQLCEQLGQYQAEEKARLLFESWREKYEKQIREDAIRRSTAIVKGRVAEQFVPFLEQFKYNPRDARFIGSPVDYIVFDGLSEDRDITIVLLEVKTGRSQPNKRERRIMNAVRNGRVRWETIRLNNK